MDLQPYMISAVVAVAVGLDRMAACQFMVSRPIVAAPVTGWLLGDALAGLHIGAMLELVWLARLPVGATIPPDDTQAAVGSTTLAVLLGPAMGMAGLGFEVLCLLTVLPLSKIGQLFDRMARNRNGLLLAETERNIAAGNFEKAEGIHLLGFLHFGGAALAAYLVTVLAGGAIVRWLAPLWMQTIDQAASWVYVSFVFAGCAAILAAINVSRSFTLFGASFGGALLMLWML